MLGGVQFETGGLGPVPYLNILGGTSQKNHPVDPEQLKSNKQTNNMESLYKQTTWSPY